VSLSPTAEDATQRESYEVGWVAVHKMLRDGKSWSGREEDCAYLNTRDGRFANASAVTGLDIPDDTRAAGLVDWDLDGKLDLWVSGRGSPRVHLFRNQSANDHAWIAISLEGRACNRDAIGARVEIVARGAAREEPAIARTLRAGEGYLAQSSRWMHFGLGSAREIARVEVRWPPPYREGEPEVEIFEELEPNARYRIVQGTGVAERWSPPEGRVELAASTPKPLAPTARARTPLAARVPLPPVRFTSQEDREATLPDGVEPPFLLVLWASWCEPCVAELRSLAGHRDEIARAGLRVVAVNVDEATKRDAATDLLRALDWRMHAGFATQELVDVLDVFQRSLVDRRRRLVLPTSFLVDHEGEVAAVYKGPVAIPTLLADGSRLRARPVEMRDAAVPFPGRWQHPPVVADLARIEAAFVERGLEEAASFYSRRRIVARESSRSALLNRFGIEHARQGKLDEAIANFREAAALDPAMFDAWSNLAAALHESGKVAEAIPLYERALRIDSRHAPTLYNLVLAHAAAGDLDRARQDLDLLAVLDPAGAAEIAPKIEAAARVRR
jgi:tetratricopeptide (TPR) repeat protein